MQEDHTSFETFLTNLSKTQDQLSLLKYYNDLREHQRYYIDEKGNKVKRKMGPPEASYINFRLNEKSRADLAYIFANNEEFFTSNFKKVLEESFLINAKLQDYHKVSQVNKNHFLKIIEVWTPMNNQGKKEILSYLLKNNPYLKEHYKEEIFQEVAKNHYLMHILDTVEEVVGDSIVNYLNATDATHLMRRNNLAYLISKGFEVNEKTVMKYIKANALSQLKIMIPFCDMTESLLNSLKQYAQKESSLKEDIIQAEKRYLDKMVAPKENKSLNKKIKL